MKRRQYLSAYITTTAGMLAGCLGSGNELYEFEASEYVLEDVEIGRVLGFDVSFTTNSLDHVEEIDNGVILDMIHVSPQEEFLSFYALAVCESIEDAEELISDFRDERHGHILDESVGDEAFSAAFMGDYAFSARLSNVLVDIVGTVDRGEIDALTLRPVVRQRNSDILPDLKDGDS